MRLYGQRGFTLLELLISLAIVGLVLLMVMGAFRMGVRAWERGERDLEALQMERIVLDLVRRQVSSFSHQSIEREGEEPFVFRGTPKSLEFQSYISTVAHNRSGIVYVRYVIQEASDSGEKLLLFEYDAFAMKREGYPEALDEDDAYILIPRAGQMRFSYLKRDDEDENGEGSEEWLEFWDPETQEGIPVAILLTFQREEGRVPIRVIARIQGRPAS